MNTEVLFMLLKQEQGKYLSDVNPWKIPKEEPWRQKFFYDMWVHALHFNSVHGYHTLTIYTPNEYLNQAIELACEQHSVEALVSLVGKKYRYEERKQVAQALYCSQGTECKKCSLNKSILFKWFS